MRKSKDKKQISKAVHKSVKAYKNLPGKKKREQAADKKSRGRSRWKAKKEAAVEAAS
ncbi:hypothetical protein LCGC14_0146040 [marine sediment metagenome]|uniref:Uncharacterized protein n=1 Tax=marine sediment metagenome TaxID=412755 RepID=A0A0F9Y1D9_9ZZZZ